MWLWSHGRSNGSSGLSTPPPLLLTERRSTGPSGVLARNIAGASRQRSDIRNGVGCTRFVVRTTSGIGEAVRMGRSGAKRYAEAVAAVREVINRLDPIGLIAIGAPEDEYDSEVTDLVRLVMRPQEFNEDEVDAVWRRWLGDDYATMHNVHSLPDQARELHRLQELYATPQ